MAALKNKLGRIACDGCGHPTVVKENEHGTLTMGCDECDLSSFAKKNTACAARWRSKLPAPAAPAGEAPAAKAPKKDADPAPAAPAKATPFQSLFGICI